MTQFPKGEGHPRYSQPHTERLSEVQPGCSHWEAPVADLTTCVGLGKYQTQTADDNLINSSSVSDPGERSTPRLRPRLVSPTTERPGVNNPLAYSSDENIVINMGQLNVLIKEATQHRRCQHANVKIKIVRRSGLCITAKLFCHSCKRTSAPIDLYSKLQTNTGK